MCWHWACHPEVPWTCLYWKVRKNHFWRWLFTFLKMAKLFENMIPSLGEIQWFCGLFQLVVLFCTIVLYCHNIQISDFSKKSWFVVTYWSNKIFQAIKIQVRVDYLSYTKPLSFNLTTLPSPWQTLNFPFIMMMIPISASTLLVNHFCTWLLSCD